MSATIADRKAPMCRRRLTVEDFHRMAEAGILGEDERVELIDGELIEMPPIGPKHADIVNYITRVFARHLGDDKLVTIQNPVHLDVMGRSIRMRSSCAIGAISRPIRARMRYF